MDEMTSVHRRADAKMPVEEVFLRRLFIEAVRGSELLAIVIDVGIRHHKAGRMFGVRVARERTVEDPTRVTTRTDPWRRLRFIVSNDTLVVNDGFDTVDYAIWFCERTLAGAECDSPQPVQPTRLAGIHFEVEGLAGEQDDRVNSERRHFYTIKSHDSQLMAVNAYNERSLPARASHSEPICLSRADGKHRQRC